MRQRTFFHQRPKRNSKLKSLKNPGKKTGKKKLKQLQRRPPRRQGRRRPLRRRRGLRLPYVPDPRRLPPRDVGRGTQAHGRLPQPDAGRALRESLETRAGHARDGLRGACGALGRQDGPFAQGQARRSRALLRKRRLVGDRGGQERLAQLRDGRAHLPAEQGARRRLP